MGWVESIRGSCEYEGMYEGVYERFLEKRRVEGGRTGGVSAGERERADAVCVWCVYPVRTNAV